MSAEKHKTVVVRDLEKKFGSFIAVDRISFDVAEGEIFGFLGPNGAGKSTTIKMLCGLLTPTSGTGRVGGFDIITQQDSIKQNIGYMSQKFSLYDDLTVEENINFYSGIYRVPKQLKKGRKDWIIKMAGLENLTPSLTRTLAVGFKQRLALGCALIHQPKIIFLDEPTAGVDPIMRNYFWELIKEMTGKGATVFVTTHYMDEAENCDRLALIYRGNIIAIGKPMELKVDFMKNDCLQVEVAGPEEWAYKLKKISGVRETALFGTAIHAIVENAQQARSAIETLFAQEGISWYKINKIVPSLEDVFVSLVESYDKTDKKTN